MVYEYPRAKARKNQFVLAIIALVSLLIIYLFYAYLKDSFESIPSLTGPDDVSTVKYSELENDTVYCITDLEILEQYEISASLDFLPSSYKYIVRFTAKDETVVYASMEISEYDKIKEMYQKNESNVYSGSFYANTLYQKYEDEFESAYTEQCENTPGEMWARTIKIDSTKTREDHISDEILSILGPSTIFFPFVLLAVWGFFTSIDEICHIDVYINMCRENSRKKRRR